MEIVKEVTTALTSASAAFFQTVKENVLFYCVVMENMD